MRVHRVPARRTSRSRRGAAAAEFAIVLPLLMTVVLGCVDFGRFAYNYIAVANAARAGAAYGMMNTYDSTSQTTWSNNIKQAVSDEISSQAGYSAANLKPVVVSTTTTGELAGDLRIVVTAKYTFSTLVTWPGIPATVDLTQTAAMRKIR